MEPSLDLSCFSGIYSVTEIIVKPSWIGSPEKELLGPDNHMLVDDHLQAWGENLATFGANKDSSTCSIHLPPPQETIGWFLVSDDNSMFGDS